MGAVPKDMARPVGAESVRRCAYQQGSSVPQGTARRFRFSKACHQEVRGDLGLAESQHVELWIIG